MNQAISLLLLNRWNGKQSKLGADSAIVPLEAFTAVQMNVINQKCTCGHTWDVMAAPLLDSYCPECGQFDQERYEKNWHQVYFVVFSFIHRFMRRNTQETQMDYVTNKIAAEIWLYNIGQTLRTTAYQDIAASLADDSQRHQVLKKCNAYSLSQYLGIPHQTVRRKIADLIERGWVVKSPDGLLSISAACEAEFKPEFNIETMRDFVASAKAVLTMLGQMPAPLPSDEEAP